MVAENLAQVQKNIQESCNEVNRDPAEVTLIAVSKTKPVEMLKEAYDAGARVFGENKVQEIVDKYDQMPSDVKWHTDRLIRVSCRIGLRILSDNRTCCFCTLLLCDLDEPPLRKLSCTERHQHGDSGKRDHRIHRPQRLR